MPQLRTVAAVIGTQPQLQHLSSGRVDLSESGVNMNLQSLPSQQRCGHLSAGNAVDNIPAVARQHAQQCKSQVHQMPVSLTESLAYVCS